MTVVSNPSLVVNTQLAPAPFEFGAETQAIEYQAYLKYCRTEGLITTPGEQSRKNLIRKTFLDKGASGGSWRAAMMHWLQAEVDSDATDIYELWLIYFDQFSTTPDSEGVTYDGLSVEGGYRKFLYEHIGLATNFYDTISVTDRVSLRRMLNISGNVTISDSVAHQLFGSSLSDAASAIEPGSMAVFSLNKKLVDAISATDLAKFKLVKGLSDSVSIVDEVALVMNGIAGISSAIGLADSLTWHMSKTLPVDTATLADILSLNLKLKAASAISLSDSCVLVEGLFDLHYDEVSATDLVLFLIRKGLSDSISLTDEAALGNPGFGPGFFGDYYFGA